MRIRVVAWALVVSSVLASVSFADEFGGMKFTAPAGKKTVDGDHVVYTNITGTTFCQYALFRSRVPTASDVAFEWKSVVEANFTASNVSQPLSGSTANAGFVAISATLTQKSDGNTFAGTLVVLAAPGAVASILATSGTAETLGKCPTKTLIDSIVLAQPPSPPAPARPPAAPAQPAAPAPAADAGAPALTTSWSTASSAYRQGVSLGYTRRLYTFKPDGTYRYYSEAWGGTYNSTWYYVVDESGAWKLDGTQLTLSPTKANGTQYDDKGKVKSRAKVSLEKATYTIQSAYMSGLKEWNLVMTPPKQTRRDGPFAVSQTYPSSYLYSNSKRLEWRFPPP
jgi:hypothetical protein